MPLHFIVKGSKRNTKHDMNDAVCLDCGYRDNINYFILDAADEGDPNPTIHCPKCGGVGEPVDE